jgi:hypothetical protein
MSGGNAVAKAGEVSAVIRARAAATHQQFANALTISSSSYAATADAAR